MIPQQQASCLAGKLTSPAVYHVPSSLQMTSNQLCNHSSRQSRHSVNLPSRRLRAWPRRGLAVEVESTGAGKNWGHPSRMVYLASMLIASLPWASHRRRPVAPCLPRKEICREPSTGYCNRDLVCRRHVQVEQLESGQEVKSSERQAGLYFKSSLWATS